MLRALCLDLMGVVLHDPYLEAIEAATEMALADVLRNRDPDAWPCFELAEIDEAEFQRRFWADPDGPLRFDAEAFHAVRRAGYRFLSGMPELIADVAGLLDRHVASNYPVWIEEVRERFDLDERFEGVWASHHLGVRKPDPEFYRRLLDKVGHPAQACLFVDDRRDNVEAARAVGMRAHLFDGAADLRARLRAEGVAIP